MTEYIYQRRDWPIFKWKPGALAAPLAALHVRQGKLMGGLAGLGFKERDEATLRATTQEIVKSSEIEGESLNADQVRSSIAKRLGIDAGALPKADRKVDGVVEMTLEATENFNKPLTEARLLRWHKLLFPGPRSINVGAWRDDSKGPMQVVSGPIGSERVHYEAPPAGRLEAELAAFFDWSNQPLEIDPILFAAQAHLWFVTLHPFDDGNGRIARAIAEWALARSDNSSRRYYSMSAQIRKERKDYYENLRYSQAGTMDITEWMTWFIACLDRAIGEAESALTTVLEKDRFWKAHAQSSLNERQRAMLNRLLDGNFEGKLTSTKWAKLMKCSQDAAYRDIMDLMGHGILAKDPAGGRSTSYFLARPKG